MTFFLQNMNLLSRARAKAGEGEEGTVVGDGKVENLWTMERAMAQESGVWEGGGTRTP